MNWLFSIIIALTLLGCQTRPISPMIGSDDKIFELPSYDQRPPSLSLAEIEKEIKKLSSVIGGYPPIFKSAQHRDETYKKWSNLLQETFAHQQSLASTEQILYLFSELYRQGHNLDVRNAAKNASKSISECLIVNSQSVPCHFSSAFLLVCQSRVCGQRREKPQFFKSALCTGS